MSKSLGNSPDPLDLIEKYGADGLRHGIMSIAPKGQDIRFSEERIEQEEIFATSFGTPVGFVKAPSPMEDNSMIELICLRIESEQVNKDDQAMLLRLAETLDQVEKFYQEYEFNSVLQAIYRLFWTDFCDWYVEVSKNRIKEEAQKGTCLAVQDICLRQILLMLHPFIPFITEELWRTLCFSSGESIEGEKPGDGNELIEALQTGGVTLDPSALKEMQEVRELVTQLRALKAERNLSNNRNIAFSFVANNEKAEAVSRNLTSILSTAGASAVNRVEEAPQGSRPGDSSGPLFLDLTVGVDLSAEKERLSKEIENLEKIIRSIEIKLSNQAFVSQAPPQVVEGARNQLIENQSKLQENQEALNAISES